MKNSDKLVNALIEGTKSNKISWGIGHEKIKLKVEELCPVDEGFTPFRVKEVYNAVFGKLSLIIAKEVNLTSHEIEIHLYVYDPKNINVRIQYSTDHLADDTSLGRLIQLINKKEENTTQLIDQLIEYI